MSGENEQDQTSRWITGLLLTWIAKITDKQALRECVSAAQNRLIALEVEEVKRATRANRWMQ